MTLIIIDDCTHNKTFSIYGKPNGAVKKLLSSGYHLNPRVHAYPPVSQADGSLAERSTAQGKPSTPPFIEEDKSGEPSVIFGKDLVME